MTTHRTIDPAEALNGLFQVVREEALSNQSSHAGCLRPWATRSNFGARKRSPQSIPFS